MKPVHVRWVDSVRHEGGWDTGAAYRDRSTEDILQHETLGWIVADFPHSVTVAQARGFEEQTDEGDVNVTEVIQIPRVAIVFLKELDLDGSEEASRVQSGAEEDSVRGLFG